MIWYACDNCAEHSPETSGLQDPSDVRVLPSGKWICDTCYNEEDGNGEDDWRDLPKPARYGTKESVVVCPVCARYTDRVEDCADDRCALRIDEQPNEPNDAYALGHGG